MCGPTSWLYLKTRAPLSRPRSLRRVQDAVLDHVAVAALHDRAGRAVHDLDALRGRGAELGGREFGAADVAGLVCEPSDAGHERNAPITKAAAGKTDEMTTAVFGDPSSPAVHERTSHRTARPMQIRSIARALMPPPLVSARR
jgi:hypothetical protein